MRNSNKKWRVSKTRRQGAAPSSRRSKDGQSPDCPLINRRFGNRRSLVLASENDEDTSQERDDSWNDTKVESENSNQPDEDEIDRQQQHPDVLVKGHASMISEWRTLSR